MLLYDSHVHTCFSFDSDMEHHQLCKEYIRRGFDRVALTDHYDIDGMEDGLYPSYDLCSARSAYEAAQENFGNKIDLVWGIEIGQPTLRFESSRRFIRDNRFEFVIGSVHNLDLIPDFIFMNFENMPNEVIEDLYLRYVKLLCKTAAFPGIHSLAHVTYPMRYIHRDGRNIDIEKFFDLYRELFHILIECGVALELNTSGIRKGYVTSPDKDLLLLYRDCGGELVTCGSDAHTVVDCGADIADCISILKDCGFTKLVIPSHDGTEQIEI